MLSMLRLRSLWSWSPVITNVVCGVIVGLLLWVFIAAVRRPDE